MDTISLDVSPRGTLRKKVKALRRTGIVPIHIYGNGIPSKALQADNMTVSKVVRQVGQNIPLYLKVEGAEEQELVFVREVQLHPVTNVLLHVDFFRVDPSMKAMGAVPIVLVGEAPAVKVRKGILMQTLHMLSVECLPMEMPERIEIDISVLEDLEQSMRVTDYTPKSGLTILTDPDELIVRVASPRIAATDGTAERPEPAAVPTSGKATESTEAEGS
jgi:large subunit ribosomal protein L25